MFHRNLICGVLASVALIGLPGMSRASAAPCGGCAPAPSCAPVMTTITVYEQVPETYTATRTTYKTECVNETYTAYRHECVPETRQVTRYVSKTICETKDVVVNKWICTPVTEMKTITKKVPVCKEVTTISRKCVDQGCYVDECVETLCSKLKGAMSKCGHCPEYKTKKVWCPNKVWVETPCTKTVRTWECVTECVPCTVMKKTCVSEVQKVTCNRVVCEPVCETITVNVSRCVPYTATRQVTKCVPVCETYTATRLVCRAVQKQVACAAPAPAADCCHAETSCCSSKKGFGGLFSGGFGGMFKKCGCAPAPSCGCGCN